MPEPDESHNVLPESWDLSSVSHFRVGVLVEQSFDDQDLRSTPALGLSVNYRNRWLSPNLRVVLRPAQSIEDTYAAVGVGVSADSVLNSPEIDPVFLAEQKDAIDPWLPTIVLRLSRAF